MDNAVRKPCGNKSGRAETIRKCNVRRPRGNGPHHVETVRKLNLPCRDNVQKLTPPCGIHQTARKPCETAICRNRAKMHLAMRNPCGNGHCRTEISREIHPNNITYKLCVTTFFLGGCPSRNEHASKRRIGCIIVPKACWRSVPNGNAHFAFWNGNAFVCQTMAWPTELKEQYKEKNGQRRSRSECMKGQLPTKQTNPPTQEHWCRRVNPRPIPYPTYIL